MTQYTLSPVPGTSAGIGFMLAEMDEVRGQLREAIQDLSDEDMSCLVVPGAHSIAALVLHIGEAEWWWIKCVVQGNKISDEDRSQPIWDVLDDPEGCSAKGYSASYCLEVVDRIRDDTRAAFAAFNDDNLETLYSRERRGEMTNHSLRWILHHLIDHEAQHKGQILMLKRLIESKREDVAWP